MQMKKYAMNLAKFVMKNGFNLKKKYKNKILI